MLCRDFRCIYVHIPKTAGESIISYFLGLLGDNVQTREKLLLFYNKNPQHGPAILTHLTAAEYLQHGFVNSTEFSSFFKFAFVRNPWDRLVSEYKFRGYPWLFDFKSFLFKHFPRPGQADPYLHVKPQYDYLHDRDGRLLADFVGRFERLKEDFSAVCRRLGFCDHTLPHINSSPPPRFSREHWRTTWPAMFLPDSRYRRRVFGHYSEFYDDESREFVADMYAKDISTFGYTFGQRPVRVAQADPVLAKLPAS